MIIKNSDIIKEMEVNLKKTNYMIVSLMKILEKYENIKLVIIGVKK